MPFRERPLTPFRGRTLHVGELDRLADAVQRATNVGGEVVQTGSGVLAPRPEDPFIWARITAVDNSTPPLYTWTQVYPDGAGGFLDLGDAAGGGPGALPAYEQNGVVLDHFPVYVRLYLGVDWCYFSAPNSTALTDFVGCSIYLALDETILNNATINPGSIHGIGTNYNTDPSLTVAGFNIGISVTAIYRIEFQATFDTNASGRRWIAILNPSPNPTLYLAEATAVPVSGQFTTLYCAATVLLHNVDIVTCIAFQNSGGSLNLLAPLSHDAGDSIISGTFFTIQRLSQPMPD